MRATCNQKPGFLLVMLQISPGMYIYTFLVHDLCTFTLYSTFVNFPLHSTLHKYPSIRQWPKQLIGVTWFWSLNVSILIGCHPQKPHLSHLPTFLFLQRILQFEYQLIPFHSLNFSLFYSLKPWNSVDYLFPFASLTFSVQGTRSPLLHLSRNIYIADLS